MMRSEGYSTDEHGRTVATTGRIFHCKLYVNTRKFQKLLRLKLITSPIFANSITGVSFRYQICCAIYLISGFTTSYFYSVSMNLI